MDPFFWNQWTEKTGNGSSHHLAGFESGKSCLSASIDRLESSHNRTSRRSLDLFPLPSLWLKSGCLQSLLSDSTLLNLEDSLKYKLTLRNKRQVLQALTPRHINVLDLCLPRHTPGEVYTSFQYSLPSAPEVLYSKPSVIAILDASPEGTAAALKTFPIPWLSRDTQLSRR